MAEQPTTQFIIKDVNVHQATGHIKVRMYAKTTLGNNSWDGPERDYGVDAASFRNRFNSDVEQLKLWLISEHKAFTGAHTDLVESLGKLKGQVIG
jgi:hypothetical protein